MKSNSPRLGAALIVPIVLFTVVGLATNSWLKKPGPEHMRSSSKILFSEDPYLKRQEGKMYYHDLPFTGTISENYPKGSLKQRTLWQDGMREGIQESWYTDGSKKELRYYKKNRKHGLHKGWYRDGNQKFLLRFTNGNYHGLCQEWHANGQLYSQRHFEDGKEIGSHKTWTPDGKILANYVIKNGRQFGLVGSKLCNTTP
ncbi:MAG: hypothetical protein AAGA18_00780 [Verrucomicrobiota bacterium]